MATESISKQQRLGENNVVREEDLDWISTLPDSILLHILSFLPTKTSVVTMPLVSRRWRYLWKDLQVFDFYNEAYKETDFERFVNFFKAVLTLRRSRDIRKMHFYDYHLPYYHHLFGFSGTFPIDSINMCIGEAMGPCLEELHLNIEQAVIWGIVDIPSTLFDCTKLVSLSLIGSNSIHLYIGGRVHFPSLRNLYLKIQCLASVDDLIPGCPILETLSIINGPDESSFCVPHSLKRLEYEDGDYDFRTYIEIDAPHLKYLSITIHGSFKAAVGSLQNVEEAHISFFVNESDSKRETVDTVLNLLRALSGTKHLTLSLGRSTTMPLHRASVLDFPHYLLHLKLELPCFNSIFLIDVLEKCHLLQDLIIQSFWGQMPRQTWEPESTRIPNCLVSTLTSIQIKGYRGLADELTFAEYILQNALVLKTMIIKSDISLYLEEKHRILKKLSNIPRCSVKCQLEFD